MIGYFLSFIRGKTGNKVELMKASDVTSSTQLMKFRHLLSLTNDRAKIFIDDELRQFD